MGFTVRSYSELTQDFTKSIAELKDHHKVSSIDDLPPERQGQVKFLQAIISQLDKTRANANTKNNPHILTGAMLVIRELIDQSYSQRSPENSKFYQLLATTLGLSDENTLRNEDVFNLVKTFRGFLSHQIFEKGDSMNGMKEDTIFAHIEGYGFKTSHNIESLGDVWKTSNKILHDLGDQIYESTSKQLKQQVSAREKAAKAEQKVGRSSLLSGLFATKVDGDNNNQKQDPSASAEQAKAMP